MADKKKILVFIDWFLPGYKAGGPIRSVANMTEHLSEWFDFYIVTRNTDYTDSEPFPNITPNKWIERDSGVFVYYISKEQLSKQTITDIIQKTDFDAAYINGMYSYYFSILPLQILNKIKQKIIVCARGMLSPQAFSRKSFKKRLFLKVSKWRNLYHRVVFHATNEHEAKDIQKRIGENIQIITAGNFSRKNKDANLSIPNKTPGELILVSIARISQEKNTLYALEVLKNITEGDVRFDLYGSIYDEEYWKNCKAVIARLPNNIQVNYRGAVREDEVPNTFSQYHFSLMPSIGENFGHSILESMAAGTPVITSTGTPWRNLSQKQAGWDIDLAHSEEFEKVLNHCLFIDYESYMRMSEAAKMYAQSADNAEEKIQQYKTLFQS